MSQLAQLLHESYSNFVTEFLWSFEFYLILTKGSLHYQAFVFCTKAVYNLLKLLTFMFLNSFRVL